MRKASEVKTLNEAIIFYLDDCLAKDFTQQTFDTKNRSLKRFEKWCLSQSIDDPKQINLDVLEGYRQYLHSYKKILDGKPLSINSKYKYLTDLKLFLRQLYKREIITNGDFEGFELPKSQKFIARDVFTHKDVLKVISYAASIQGDIALRNRCVVELLYSSGVRRNELAELKVENVDIDRQSLRVIEGKGLKDRVVPIAKSSALILKQYLNEARPKLLSLISEDYIFLREDGRQFGADAMGQMVGKMIRRAGVLKGGACHQFRHAAATGMLNSGADIRFIQAFLGHSDISTTQLYTHVALKELTGVYNKTHPSALHQNIFVIDRRDG